MAAEDLIKKSESVIEHIDDVKARKILKEIESVFSDSRNQSNRDLLAKLDDLKTKLEIVALPNLTDEVAENVLRHHYLESFNIGIDMENRLTAKLFFVPEIPRDELRKKLQKAILENDEQFGPLTVGQWLREFEKMFNIHTRDRSAPVRFVTEHPQARALSEIDKAKLKEIIYTYDYLLVSTLPATGPVLEEILNSSMAERRETREIAEARPVIAPVRTGGEGSRSFYEPLMQRRTARFPGGPSGEAGGIESLPLLQALQKYPRLGEQAVTSSPIKLKIFPDPVRPSIKNWIAEYHSVLGAGTHGTMERGNFLYHSENAKRLSFGERQKLAVILKSLDENEPVAVDEEKQEIVFSPHPETLSPPAGVAREMLGKPPLPAGEDAPTRVGAGEGEEIRFSYPQKLQSERPSAPPPPPPSPPVSPPPPPMPLKPEPRIEGNMVDLRG